MARTQHQRAYTTEEKEAKVTQLKSDLSELKTDLQWGICTPTDDAERDELVAMIDRLLSE